MMDAILFLVVTLCLSNTMCKSITNLLYRKLIFKEKNKIIFFSASSGRHLFQTEIRVDFRKPNKMRLLFLNQNRISDIHVLPKFSELLKFRVFFPLFNAARHFFLEKSEKKGLFLAGGRQVLKTGPVASSLMMVVHLRAYSQLPIVPNSTPSE
jgi:hypothetical protein